MLCALLRSASLCFSVFLCASLCLAVLRCALMCFAMLRWLCSVYRLLAALCVFASDTLCPMLAGSGCFLYLFVYLFVVCCFVLGAPNFHGSVLRYAWLCFAVLRCLCSVYRMLAALCVFASDTLRPMLAGSVCVFLLLFLFFVFGLHLHGAEGNASTAHEHAER